MEQARKNLFYSAAYDLWQCPKKFDLSFNQGLRLKEEPTYFTYGRKVDEGLCIASELLETDPSKLELFFEEELKQLPEGIDKGMWSSHILDMINWYQKHVYDIDYGIPVELPLGHSESAWLGEADLTFRLLKTHDQWMGEVKTTSGYGTQTAKMYMEDPQAWGYLYSLKRTTHPDLKGFYIFALTKTKDPKLFPEPVPLVESKLKQIENWIYDSFRKYYEHSKEGYWPHNRLACFANWSQCFYWTICQYPDASEEYKELILQSYEVIDPYEHLKRRKEVKSKWLK